MIIKAQKGRGNKIHLLLDDEYKITTDVDFWYENLVPDGTDLSDEEWSELVRKINYRKAFNKCADYLSRRSHSVKELREKLLRTVDKASADSAIEKFTELGYLDDESFAFEYTEYLFNKKKYSVNRVRQELFGKGISKEIIDKAVDSIETDQVETIIAIINKSYLNKLNGDGGREKVIAALMRRGFSYSDIKEAFNRIKNGE